ncbi:hypothetical protein NC653_000611 [Populus alba x Populus x berolinensis]|uniref:Uncharacterized protein n=1 Tax=Populus alba x Populus x berolinensis TaxID=444605 RepID=A0AAD6WFJ9_9ROSI|nr:hypothetical protein NC653_000611 [Populus alba x Populus x berolinensis]
MENGGPLAGRYFSSVSHIAGREGWLLLILLLQLRKGMASADSDSAGSIIVAEEGYGRGGGYSWASGAELRKRWDEWRVVSWGCVDREGRGKVLDEKGGGTVTAVVEREGGNCLLVGRENREFVFN